MQETAGVDKLDETEQLLRPKHYAIKDTLNLLRSDNIISVDEVNQTQIEFDDFKEALKKVVPSSKREGFVTVPNVTWDDIGSLKKIRQELHMAMLVSLLTLLLHYNIVVYYTAILHYNYCTFHFSYYINLLFFLPTI